jgi:hypothetical protein
MTDVVPSIRIQDEVVAFLLAAPTPEQILNFHASPAAQARLQELLAANRAGTLTDDERAELDEASHTNHFFMLIKAKALETLQTS